MRILVKIFVFLLVIFIGIYFFKPKWLHENTVFEKNNINIQQYTLTPNPGKLFLLNLKIISSENYKLEGIKSGIQAYFDAVDLFKVNILDLLQDANNKKIVLNTHIRQLEKIQSQLGTLFANITDQYQEEMTQMQEFLNQKNYGDSEFSNGFNMIDSQMVLNGLDTSYKNGPEYIKHRILANGLNIVAQKIKNVKYYIDTKLNLLQNNEDTIYTNYDLIRGNLLNKLLELKIKLETPEY